MSELWEDEHVLHGCYLLQCLVWISNNIYYVIAYLEKYVSYSLHFIKMMFLKEKYTFVTIQKYVEICGLNSSSLRHTQAKQNLLLYWFP